MSSKAITFFDMLLPELTLSSLQKSCKIRITNTISNEASGAEPPRLDAAHGRAALGEDTTSHGESRVNSQASLNAGCLFSMKACIPSFWSASAKQDQNSLLQPPLPSPSAFVCLFGLFI